LRQQAKVDVEIVLRVLAANDSTGRIRILARTLFYEDKRKADNSLEALDSLLPQAVFRPLLPLLEDADHDRSVRVASKFFKMSEFGDEPDLIDYIIGRGLWLELTLLLAVLKEHPAYQHDSAVHDQLRHALEPLTDDYHLKHMHPSLQREDRKERSMEPTISLTNKILLVRDIDVFSDLSVSELAAVASVTEAVSHPANQVVIREGDMGETMFLIVKGRVVVIKNLAKENELELDQIGTGEYFGEMALFEDRKRSASIRTLTSSEFLVLHKAEFNDIVHEFPEIALNACRVLGDRIRKLHAKFAPTD